MQRNSTRLLKVALALLLVAFCLTETFAQDDNSQDDSESDFSYGPRSFQRPCNIKGRFDLPPPTRARGCDIVADYIVVGTGAGGAAVTRVLSDDFAYSVLALEAGQNKDADPNVQSAFGSQTVSVYSSSTYGWQIKSAFEESVFKNFDVSVGRMLGGSTSHNGMMYVQGSLNFFDECEAAGGSSWSAANIKAAFKQIERYNRQGLIDPSRGLNGLVDVRRPANGPSTGAGSMPTLLANWTATASGIPVTPDYNGDHNFGPFVRYDLFENPDFTRASASTEFLASTVMNADGTGVGGRQLRVLFESTVVRVIFDGINAVGVEFLRDGRTDYAWARKEIVLSGSIFTTQILQNSGIGDATLLNQLGVPVVYNNPNVGAHLLNHQSLMLDFKANPAHLPALQDTDPFALYAGGAFFPSWTADGPVSQAELSNPRKYQTIWLGPFFNGDPYIHLFLIQLRPKSQGYVKIQSKDPLQVPYHKENMFSDPADLQDFGDFLYHGIQNTLLGYFHAQDPLYDITWGRWNTSAQAQAFVASKVAKSFHYTNTNRMAPSAATGVVNSKGQVYGVRRLRVADSSVIPGGADGNTAALTMVYGWKIAQMMVQAR